MKKLKDLLMESNLWDREFGEPLPTLSDVQKRYEKKKLQEDQYGSEDKKFVPVKIDKYAPDTRQNLSDSIRSLSGAAFGFSLSEDSEMDYPDAAKAAHIAYNKWAKGMGVKFQKLYKELNSGWKVYHDTFDKEVKKGRK